MDVIQHFRGETDAGPDGRDFLLDRGGGQVWQITAGAAGVPSEAEEVVIAATLAFAPTVADTATTASTHQTALEVMPMSPGAIPGYAASSQNVLDLLPGDLIDEGFVFAVEEHVFETDLAFVVGLG
nr:hypothetical protein [Mycobacteroides abscessus]